MLRRTSTDICYILPALLLLLGIISCFASGGTSRSLINCQQPVCGLHIVSSPSLTCCQALVSLSSTRQFDAALYSYTSDHQHAVAHESLLPDSELLLTVAMPCGDLSVVPMHLFCLGSPSSLRATCSAHSSHIRAAYKSPLSVYETICYDSC